MKASNLLSAAAATTAIVGLLLATSAGAHHSPAVFDRTQTRTLEGVVTNFSWSNPHSWIHVDVTGEDGSVENWTIEMNPATILARGGWRRNSVEPGDRVTVHVHPLRTDERGGQFVALTKEDGTALGEVPALLGETPQR
jgi:hypothetical protein